MSKDAKFCCLAALVALAVWGAIVWGVHWHWQDALAHQRPPIAVGEAFQQ